MYKSERWGRKAECGLGTGGSKWDRGRKFRTEVNERFIYLAYTCRQLMLRTDFKSDACMCYKPAAHSFVVFAACEGC